ncbi:McrA Restriction endonuclease [uncultured Caudovirales phage]|uniref:McrA Restriction endonuclease n=1 Tax=uncultured Caudovirales phage TaxID=2100421 RepID=A0A6J7XEJ9_9CAUD|nr:McrA Restriction endonuclease [uncultured Caudovirales phage]
MIKGEIVLVLNRCWQAIGTKTVADALSMMYSDSATGLDIQSSETMIPNKWQDWINLPYDENSNYIKTVRGDIKIPKVIILCKYDRVPQKRPKFSFKALWQRDGGVCQYTNKKLTPNEANIDHIIPRSRGGKTSWTNCVVTHREVNARKANMTPEEANLRLVRPPKEPKCLPITFYIKNYHQIPEWNLFLDHIK